jgi:hypothetical protein
LVTGLRSDLAGIEQLTKEIGCETIVSEEVFHQAGGSATSLPQLAPRLRGREDPVPVRVLRNTARNSSGLSPTLAIHPVLQATPIDLPSLLCAMTRSPACRVSAGCTQVGPRI